MTTPDRLRLFLFTLVWTAAWVLPVPRLPRWAELAAGLIPFAAFGLRVFAGFFVGVPADDPVRVLVRPRSRFLFAMAIGVAAGAMVALYA